MNKIIVTIGEGELITKDIVNDYVKLDRSLFLGREIMNSYGKIEDAIITSRECLYNCSFCGGARSLNFDVKVRTSTNDDIINELRWIEENNPNCTCIRILDDLNELSKRGQFNFSSGNYSKCDIDFIKKLIVDTNELGNIYENKRDRKM